MSDGPDWVRDAVFYQIFPDRFCNGDPANDPPGTVPWSSTPTRDNFFGGDLAGVLERLPYLEDLGINALYLTPIFRAGTNHRYDTYDYYAVDPALGDAGLLRELVQEAHTHGIRVVLDAVFNHVGDQFFAFDDLRKHGESSAYRDWFILRGDRVETDPLNYQTCGGTPYLPKLDTSNPEVSEYLLEVATHWLTQADIDGWRADVPWKVPLEFWHAFRSRVKDVKPDAYIVGEAWGSWGPLRDVFDGLMNYRLRGDLFDFCLFDRKDAEDLMIESRLLIEEAGGGQHMLNLLGSHDTPRLATLAEGDADRAELALVALFTYPGVPMLYYGDEVGLEGGDDPDCRRPMPWDEAAWHHPTRDLVKRLIELRGSSPALTHGDWQPLLAFNRVLAFRRAYLEDEVVVVLNAGPERRDFAIELPTGSGTGFVDALTGETFAGNGPTLTVPVLRARSARVLVPNPELLRLERSSPARGAVAGT